MTKTRPIPPTLRFVNPLSKFFIRLGIGSRNDYLLGVYGRKTGSLYSTPVSLVIQGNQRFLVAPFGEVNWVRNARASGQVILSRRGQQEVVKLHELNPSEGAPILKTYLAMRPFTAPYFDNRPDAPVEAFEQEASNHPVFRISPSAE